LLVLLLSRFRFPDPAWPDLNWPASSNSFLANACRSSLLSSVTALIPEKLENHLS
jgi:hypothetical protein